MDRSKTVLPPFYIKLSVMKQFVKAFIKSGDCFRFICTKFSGLSIEKLNVGMFDGSQIRRLIDNYNFSRSMSEKECSF